tara:strand:+ start:75 stop:299 length:225 start_codon:yes stop_codon:yes gene_type:complete
MKIIPCPQLSASGLLVDAVYDNSHDGLLAGESLSKIFSDLVNLEGRRRNFEPRSIQYYARFNDYSGSGISDRGR